MAIGITEICDQLLSYRAVCAAVGRSGARDEVPLNLNALAVGCMYDGTPGELRSARFGRIEIHLRAGRSTECAVVARWI